jgi:DNA helicase HerA-like ATPase
MRERPLATPCGDAPRGASPHGVADAAAETGSKPPMKVELSSSRTIVFPEERREPGGERALGRLVSINGTEALVACEMAPGGGEFWSIGHLIAIDHGCSRVVGIVCELTAADRLWNERGANVAYVKVELAGEVVDDDHGAPSFFRGVRSYPALGALAHRIDAGDLKAVYSFHGVEGVEIGRLSQNEAIPAVVSVDELISRHFAVIGSTGVGKTTAVAMLLKKCLASRPKLRALIIDPHNEYARHFPTDSVVFHCDNLELPYWMFKFEEIADVVYSGRKPNSDEMDALFDVIKTAKAQFVASSASMISSSSVRRSAPTDNGWISADTPVPYRVADMVAIIDEWLGKLDQRYPRSDLRALKYRLETLSRDPRFRFMFGRVMVEDNMERVLSRIFRLPKAGAPVSIIQLAGLPNEVVDSLVSVLARMAFEIALWSEGSYQIAVVCEEAHRYIPTDRSQAFGPTRQAIGRIAKEGRKYGASLGVVTQRPAELDATVLSQCSTMFAMRLANEFDKAIVRSAVGASSASTIAFLSSIADREAIAFGEAIATPMRMKFGDYRREAARSAPPAAESEGEPRTAHLDLRKIVCRLRGEYVGDAYEQR